MKKISKKKARGRPKSDNPAKARLPVVQVTPERLKVYRTASDRSGKTFSQWVRDSLDKSAEE